MQRSSSVADRIPVQSSIRPAVTITALPLPRAALEASSQRTFKHALPHVGSGEAGAAGGVMVVDLKRITHDHRQLLVDRGVDLRTVSEFLHDLHPLPRG